MKRVRWIAMALAAWVTPAAVARAAELGEDLDGDGVTERVAVDAAGTLRVSGASGEWGAVRAPAAVTRVGEVQKLEVVRAGGRVFVHARIGITGDTAHAVEEVGLVEGRGLREVASFVAGPDGPDGERSLELRADGEGIVRYQTAPGVARCDGFALLFPELYDVDSHRFRPVSIAPPTPANEEAITAQGELPALAKEPPLGLFSFVAAASERGDERRADRLAPPREIDDGRLDTAWYEGAAGSGRGAFVTARSQAGEQALVGIALAAAPGNRLASVTLLVGATPLHVELGAPAPGRWLWIPLAGRRADCVSIALDEIERHPPGDDSGIAEARIYTQGDGPGGVARLIEQVERGGSQVEVLLPLLADHPRAVAEALPAAAPKARRLLLRALAAGAAPEAAMALVAALPSANPDDRELIVGALAEGNPLAAAARQSIAALLVDRSVPLAARRVALDLSVRAPGGAQRVWAALEQGALDDHALVEAAIGALSAAPIGEALAALSAHDEGKRAPTTVRVLGALAGRLHGGDAASIAQRGQAVELLLALAPSDGASDFEASFRWLRAARQAASPLLLPAIERAAHDQDEALRWAAIEAAAAIDDRSGAKVVRDALADHDPRVRAAALVGLGALANPSLPALAEQALRNDRWPMVRRAAAEQLAPSCPATAADALTHVAVVDHDEPVAIAALSSLARCDRARAAPLALRLATEPRARLDLRERATAITAELRPAGAAARLAEALLDLLDLPGSDDRHAGLASSITRALGRLGDPAGEPGLERALAEPLLPALRVTALDALATLCTDAARRAILGATRDGDESVRHAAELAGARCH